jgi:hypothetical protein
MKRPPRNVGEWLREYLRDVPKYRATDPKGHPSEWYRLPDVTIGEPLWNYLREIAIKHGIDPKHIPQEWTYDAEKTLYMWIGHAVVCRELEPRLQKERDLLLKRKPKRKGGRRKGVRNKVLKPASKDANRKRRQRANFPYGTEKISDKEFFHRFDRHYAPKKNGT